MKKNVKILDCSLRDGGRTIDCAFPDEHITGITQGLTDARIDIVEVGFLCEHKRYQKNSTFFNEIDQITPFIPEKRGNTMYVAFSDYGEEFGMWDFSKLKQNDGTTIDGIRVGYRKKDLMAAIPTFKIVKEKGYKLFVQGVESLSYSDKEMLEAIEIINEIKPYSFGIVDTYGAMYKEDVVRLYNLVNHNLDEDIAIDFHSHNNMQLSFSFAQEIVELSNGVRPVIIDSTLEGLGKGTGNLNTELIVDFLNRKKYYNYNIDSIFDTIDEYIQWIKKDHTWEYKIPYFMAGIYSSHANNITYLTNKHRLRTRDILNIIARIEPAQRKRYNYDNIEKLYIDYFNSEIDDRDTLDWIQQTVQGRNLLLLAPGKTVTEYADIISKYAADNKPVVISVNFVHELSDIVFFGNQRKYDNYASLCEGKKVVVPSNITAEFDNAMQVNYNSIINLGSRYFDNSMIMLLLLLKRCSIFEFAVAGFDGFDINKDNYYSEQYNSSKFEDDYAKINEELEMFLRQYGKGLDNKTSLKLITPGRFSGLFADQK